LPTAIADTAAALWPPRAAAPNVPAAFPTGRSGWPRTASPCGAPDAPPPGSGGGRRCGGRL